MTTVRAAAVHTGRHRVTPAHPPLVAVGERAHYVVVGSGGWRLHRSLWGASAVLSELVAGPRYALRRIADREPTGADGWLDHADAGVLVDEDRRVLLFFGAHRQALPLDLRAALFAVLRRGWPGWSVRWAYGGTADLQAYVGIEDGAPPVGAHAGVEPELSSREPGRHVRSGPHAPGWYRAPWWSDAIGTLVTVRHAAGDVLIHPLDPVRTPVWAGPSLIGRMPPGVRELSASTWPACGLHLDLGRRSVSLWTAATFPGWQSSWFDAAWSGWDITFWQDRIDPQLAACAGALRTPPVRTPAGAVRLAHLLMGAWSEPADSPHLDWLRGLEPAVGPVPVEGVTAQAREEAVMLPTSAERRDAFLALHQVAADAAP